VPPQSVTVQIVHDLPPAALRILYETAGWWSAADREEDLPALIAGSACVAAAFQGGLLVGFGRVLSDGCSDAYLQDVMVLPECRGQGIGAAIVAALCGWCRERGLGWIGLVAQPGTAGFYERLGFAALSAHIAMRLPEERP
jgi:GNAT superfamily N-acetyltransferase